MKTHTVEGQRMLERVGGLLARVGVVVRASHERYDGGGYPDGLAGEAIPLAARIVSACDAYNAMTTDRSYRKALSRRASRSPSCATTPARSSTPTSSTRSCRRRRRLSARRSPARGRATVAVPAPGAGPGCWAGAPSAALDDDGAVLLAYRVRDVERRGARDGGRPSARRRALHARGHARQGPLRRGVARAAGARADGDGRLAPLRVLRDAGQQALVDRRARRRRPRPGWRAPRRGPCSPATTRTGVKDPVVRRDDGRWRAWICCHPLDEPGEEDRMTTALADERRRPGVGLAGHRARPRPGDLGRPRRARHRRAAGRARVLRRPGDEGGELPRAHRLAAPARAAWPLRRRSAGRRALPRRRSPSPEVAGGCSTRRRCPTAATSSAPSSSRPRDATAPTRVVGPAAARA